MSRGSRVHHFAVAALLPVVAGCDFAISPAQEVSGTIRFEHSGLVTDGVFSASGNTMGVENPSRAARWAQGTIVVGGSGRVLQVTANMLGPNGSTDAMSLTFSRSTVGSTVLGTGTCVAVSCSLLAFSIASTDGGVSYIYACTLTDGTAVIATGVGGRATGTFSGTGTCTTNATGAVRAISVSNGTFNVPVFGGD
jgi:hypothetical protein